MYNIKAYKFIYTSVAVLNKLKKNNVFFFYIYSIESLFFH